MMYLIEQWFLKLSTFEKEIFVFFVILFIVWVWKYENNTLNKCVFSFFRPTPIYKLAINKKQFVCEVVCWGINNLSYDGTDKKRKMVNVEVSYYPHKKIRGIYYSYQNKIRIYVNNHPDIDGLIDTTLHEVVHLLQYCADKKNFEKRYSTLLQEKTYANHPMEIEARKFASANIKACKKYMIEKGKLKIQQ